MVACSTFNCNRSSGKPYKKLRSNFKVLAGSFANKLKEACPVPKSSMAMSKPSFFNTMSFSNICCGLLIILVSVNSISSFSTNSGLCVAKDTSSAKNTASIISGPAKLMDNLKGTLCFAHRNSNVVACFKTKLDNWTKKPYFSANMTILSGGINSPGCFSQRNKASKLSIWPCAATFGCNHNTSCCCCRACFNSANSCFSASRSAIAAAV